MARSGPFSFVQFDFGFELGPPDGRYVVRPDPEGETRSIVVLSTETAGRRRRTSRRRLTGGPGPPELLASRATIVAATPLPSAEEAEGRLSRLRGDRGAVEAVVEEAAAELNGLLRAHRLAVADPVVREVSSSSAAAVRVGHGSGDQVADGGFEAAHELPGEQRRRLRRGELLAPQERLVAVLGGRLEMPPSEELVLRARADLAARRPREAALQARIALEALLAEAATAGGRPPGPDAGALEAARGTVSDAANAALEGELSEDRRRAVAEAVALMAAEIRRRAVAEG